MITSIEVGLLKDDFCRKQELEDIIFKSIESKLLNKNSIIYIPSKKFTFLNEFEGSINCISIDDIADKIDREHVEFYYYEFSEHIDPELEVMEAHDEQITSSMHWILPNRTDLNGLWESLVYDNNLKENLLNFAKTILLFSEMAVDQNIISCNRLILLHGKPGTGKTSLAKALAQKLSIRMNNKYQFSHLFEINSHSLFSRYFSESGKLVMKLFQQIQDVIEMESNLVIVLIDEVESIAFARENISNNEPSDSVRVVNSVLTQLDKIKRYPNVLIIATSNLTKSIDLAFLDRADIVMMIEQPSFDAILKIISSAINELADKGMIVPDSIDDGRDDFNIDTINNYETFLELQHFSPFSTANIMCHVCKEAAGISGRSLRKLPFLAHALFLKKSTATLREFLIAMRSAVDYTKRNKDVIQE
ncbi:pachytene checkpoint protein 2 homolog [Chironomus tepperi]|uniref:pachytene checkpoint protein 2 homolog n=1 Tax=Chironomus tepperi TaxID=113505 RepID=UPI00391F0556